MSHTSLNLMRGRTLAFAAVVELGTGFVMMIDPLRVAQLLLGEEISAPYNAPATGQTPTMDGFVTDYISTLTAELGRQPTYEE